MKLSFSGLALLSLLVVSCGSSSEDGNRPDTAQTVTDTAKQVVSVRADTVTYMLNGKLSKGFIAYDENRSGRLPIVVVIPEWWGLVDYSRTRAKQLASLGYFAIDADLYGNGDTATNPMEAMAFTKPYYTNPALALPAVEAAIRKASSFSRADSTRVAAIGYCFGGFIVLNAAKLGAPLKAAVSFHGDLSGLPPKKELIKGEILICQGGADSLVPEAARVAFKKSMDSVGAHYVFIEYPGAMHAFTNPNATAIGAKFNMPVAYDASADSASWKAMQDLLLTTLR